jgi:hypothetical protein
MPISIFLVNSAEQLDRVFQLRYDVYTKEEKRFPEHPSERIFDRFDCFPGTFSVLAVDREAGTAVGTVRFAMRGTVGLPSDSFYDFGPVVSRLDGPVATMGMLAVRKQSRHHRGVLAGLLKVAWRKLRAAGAQHIVAPVSPDAEPLLLTMGAQHVGAPFDYGHPPVRMTPIHLDMRRLRPGFREDTMDPQGILFEDFHERRLYRRGEVVFNQGDIDENAYLIIRGTAEVEIPAPATNTYPLGPGEIFGELALLDGDSQPVSVRAQSRMLDVAVIPRDQFQHRLTTNIEFGARMLRILGRRTRRLLTNAPPEAMIRVDQEALVASVLLEVSLSGTEPVEKRWLASDCGMKPPLLSDVIAPWIAAGAVAEDGDLLTVTHPTTLEVIVDHVVESYLLAQDSGIGASAPKRLSWAVGEG